MFPIQQEMNLFQFLYNFVKCNARFHKMIPFQRSICTPTPPQTTMTAGPLEVSIFPSVDSLLIMSSYTALSAAPHAGSTNIR